MTLAGYEFEGPIMNSGDLKTLPGVFAVVTVVNTTPVLIDIDSGLDVCESAMKHPRRKVWRSMSKPVGYVFVVRYQNTDDEVTREALVKEIRGKMDVPCG